MKSHFLAFIDVETTGHNPLKMVNGVLVSWHEIIDLATVVVDPAQCRIVDEFEIKIRPQYPERCLPNLVNNYPERAAAGEWSRAIPLRFALKKYMNGRWWMWSRKEPLVLGGQNFFFDWTFLTVAFALTGYDEREIALRFHYSRFDTRSMAIQELRDPKTPFDPNDWSIRNERLIQRLGLEPEPLVHTAINGARKSFEVFKKLEQMKQIRTA